MLEGKPQEDVGPEADSEPEHGEDVVVLRDGEEERDQLVDVWVDVGGGKGLGVGLLSW